MVKINKNTMYAGVVLLVVSAILGLTYFVGHQEKKSEADMFVLNAPKLEVKAPALEESKPVDVLKIQESVKEPAKAINMVEEKQPVIETTTKPDFEPIKVEKPKLKRKIVAQASEAKQSTTAAPAEIHVQPVVLPKPKNWYE